MKAIHQWTIRRSGVGLVVEGFDEVGPCRVTGGVKVTCAATGRIQLIDHYGKTIAELSTDPVPVDPPQDGATR